jgi:hypothetical protein
MTLFYLHENPKYRWGYREFEEDVELAADVGIIAEQQAEETREEFFNRVGDRPAKDMYGSIDAYFDEYDATLESLYAAAEMGYGYDKLKHTSQTGVLIEAAENGNWLEELVNHESPDVRIAVYEQGYGIQKALETETDSDAYEELIQYMLDNDEFYTIPVEKTDLLCNMALDSYLYHIQENFTKDIAEWFDSLCEYLQQSRKSSRYDDFEDILEEIKEMY